MEQIEKESIMGLAAIATFIADRHFGFDPRDVLLPDEWFVKMVKGRPEVCIYERGMRILSTLSSDPKRSHAITDRLIAKAYEMGQVR